MSKESDAVKILYTKLSASDKIEVKRFIKEYDEQAETRTYSNLNEWLNQKRLGPTATSGVCTCCHGSGMA